MRLLDRVLIVLGGLFLIACVTIVALAPDSVVHWLASIEETSVLLRLLIVVLVNVVILAALYLGLRGIRNTGPGLAMRASGAFTDVSIESTRSLLLKAVEGVPGVISAEAVVKAINGRADIDLDVKMLDASVPVPKKQKEISRALRLVINKQLGLRLHGRPRVHIRLAADEALPEPAAQPAPVVEAEQDTLVVEPEEEAEAAQEKTPWLSSFTSEKDKQNGM